MSLIGRIVLAVVVAIVVWLVLTAFLGPVLISLKVPIAETIGHAFVEYGYVIGVLCGLWYYFAGGSFHFGRPA